jgi:ribosomal protein S18 acetylase RimI-like enzyme
MAPVGTIEVLDLRHFASPQLRPVLEIEGEQWRELLHWDYRASTRLLMQYLDGRMLPGYAAVEEGAVTGYAFCVYEETKAVIGDVFALNSLPSEGPESFASAHEIERKLLRHLLEMLLNSPQVDRVESQLLLQPSGFQISIFHDHGFRNFPRLFMMQRLDGHWGEPTIQLTSTLELRPWRDEDLNPAARLICEAYRNHADAIINDQYRTVHGSLRFLNNIVRYSGCGVFSAQVSHVIVERASRVLVALVLGSRVSPESGHITQLCVHPEFRRRGLARQLLSLAAFRFMRQGVTEISLTVTASNSEAIALYESEGFYCHHRFDATVWQRPARA